MNEIWKDIQGYEGLYQVSNLGRVRNSKNKLMKTYLRNGYCRIDLSKEGKRSKHSIHRLVATTFIPNPENKPQVDHINTVRNDNRVDNLRWVTPKENMNNPITRNKIVEITSSEEFRVKMSKIGKGKPNIKNRKKIVCITTGKEFNSVEEGAKFYNMHASSLSYNLRGKTKRSGRLEDGTWLQWKYLEETA